MENTFENNEMKIKIIGIGGGGGNTVKRLSKRRDQFGEIEFYAANTDAMALQSVQDEGEGVHLILLGKTTTKGNGAGAIPEKGRIATEESQKELEEAIGDAKLLFIAAGMGGGTGTGGAPVVAQIARERQILTIGVVTSPFEYEGPAKNRIAKQGIDEMRKYVDVLIVASNQKAFETCGSSVAMQMIFEKADEVLANSIKGITDIIFTHSLVNLDFADISTVLSGKKTAHIGLGSATGENRMFKALRMASNNELLNTTIEKAKNVIVNIVADNEISGDAIEKALGLIPKVVDKDARIIPGIGFDKNLHQEVHVTIIATGLSGEEEPAQESADEPVESTDLFAEATERVEQPAGTEERSRRDTLLDLLQG